MRRTFIGTIILLLAVPPLAPGVQEEAQPSQRLDPKIQKIVSEISADRIAEIEKKLESFETRNTLSDPHQPNRGIGAARQWIFDQFKSYSPRLQVSFDAHTIPKAGRVWKEIELRNVVAVLPGKMQQAASRWIMITGHYDSLNLRVPPELRNDPAKAVEIVAPGVTDDGSGTACVMECARVLSQYEFDATLVFVAFAGEEQGLIGARAMAKRLKEKSQTIQAVLNNDIIGSEVSGNGVIDNRRVLVMSEDPNDSPSRQVARYVKRIGERYFPEMTVDLIFRYDRFGRGGDHTAFNQEGFAGVRLTTPNENFANQHSPTDTFANTSPTYAAKVTRINAAAAAAMALAPRSPIVSRPRPAAAATTGTAATAPAARVTNPATAAPTEPDDAAAPRRQPAGPGISRGGGYDAVLRWDHPDAEPDLAGFIVVVRSTTSPDWEREIWAGNVSEFTLKNTSIDQLVFGVKAVDKEGHESPVSAYVMAARAR
ncbi:MAG TPA: M20/M25/M40 family metallo-hydrolase [Blastocatellia bacterium]|nr:M20/M25/M40 family metallo-hydrolase [Blastocatellia bacterium]